MNENLDAYGKSLSKQELEIERALRPEAFQNFAGQEQVVENLLIFTRAAVQRGESLDHVLLHGPPGKNAYYVLGVDVGRFKCTTEVCVFKVTPQSQGVATKSLVNIYTMQDEHFED